MVLTHFVATFFLLQFFHMTSENTFKGFESATNMFSPVAHDDDGGSLLLLFRCVELCIMLALGYAICNEYCKSGSCDVIKNLTHLHDISS